MSASSRRVMYRWLLWRHLHIGQEIMQRSHFNIICVRLVSILIACCFLAGCSSFFFQPHKQLYRDPAKIGLAFEDVYFYSTDVFYCMAGFFLQKAKRREPFYFYTATPKISARILPTSIGYPRADSMFFCPTIAATATRGAYLRLKAVLTISKAP
jgi:hypothetical protein